MTSEDYQRAGDLFNQLREIPASARSAALDAACAGNAELHARVLRLLQADREATDDSFLERRAIEDAARLLTPDHPQSTMPGTRLGPYEIVALVGSGGMGEVFKARDTRLDRNVAVKISAERFSERFERECRAVAALNHPNICTLFDVGANYLVMEYIEGPTLAERIAAGAIPWAEALALARQTAEALEAAHEKGIVHRDLKPANIKLTADGKVKVLDFGLAKVLAANTASNANSTRMGIILGTPGYMSPEQARGTPADKRADIWSYGVVLFEMLTGRRAFGGETVSDTLAAVLRAEPDWAALPPETPLAVRRLLRRCLERDQRNRLPDIAVARLEIDEAQAAPAEVPAPPLRRSWLAWQMAMAAVALIALIAGIGWWRASRPAPAAPTRTPGRRDFHGLPSGEVQPRQNFSSLTRWPAPCRNFARRGR
ncbi:MAG: serine/threonine protein kinase [Acidobacteriota bacterium]|nr:serine/threonine protein kinase [Acidobacteriota bacterium]